jgi:hypothetical protein
MTPKERHTLRVFALDMTAAEVALLRDADAVLEPGQVLPYLRTDAAVRLLGGGDGGDGVSGG